MFYIFKNEVVDYNFINSKQTDTILFLHGWGGNKFSFQQTINLVKSKFNILTITMPTINTTTSIWNLFDYLTLIENLLQLHSILNPIVICHSFGFRIAMLLSKKIKIKKIIVTGGAGPKKDDIFRKIIKNHNKIMLNHIKFKNFYKKIASRDYLSLSNNNRETFKNIVNLNLKFAIKLNCPTLLFWGKKDKETPMWIAKLLQQKNDLKLIKTKGDHFTYLSDIAQFNHEVLIFLKSQEASA